MANNKRGGGGEPWGSENGRARNGGRGDKEKDHANKKIRNRKKWWRKKIRKEEEVK